MASILMCVIFNFNGPKIAQLRISIKRAKMLLKDSWPLLMTGVIASIYMKIDQIMLGQIAGDGAVGVYSAAIRISELWYFLPTVVTASMTPALLEAKQQNEEKYNRLLQYLFSILIFIAFIIALPISLMSTTIIVMLYGVDYVESGKILSVSIWTCIFMYFNIVSSLWFVANNRQILIFWRSIFGLIINITLNYIFIPNYGAIGAAFSTLAAQFVVYFLIDCFMKETRSIFKMKINSLRLFKTFNLIRNIK
jgi:PST family polysaccharide transporter